MIFTITPYKGISKNLLFGISRDLVRQEMFILGISDYTQGGAREWIEELDLVIHYSDEDNVTGYEFFLNHNLEIELLHKKFDLLSHNYEEIYRQSMDDDFFVVRLNDSFIAFSLGYVIGYSDEKNNNIESIYVFSNKDSYKKIIMNQISEFY